MMTVKTDVCLQIYLLFQCQLLLLWTKSDGICYTCYNAKLKKN